MKIKKLIYSIILFLFALSNQAFAKALPPGSGIGDVPANVLIMLDKSGSMGWRMSGGTASMRYPCLLYTSPSTRDDVISRMPSSA